MRVISLTSVPPRFGGLGPVLESLLSQSADAVVLTLPRVYQRFPGSFSAPPVPEGVTLRWTKTDLGPATKVLPLAAALRDRGAEVIYCDDDCLYAPGWADALWQRRGATQVAAASTFGIARLKRQGGLVAQGFAGVAIAADMIGAAAMTVPDAVRQVDDLWVSAHFALAGLEIVTCAEARALVTPLAAPAGLQAGPRAHEMANAVDYIHKTFGIWPALP